MADAPDWLLVDWEMLARRLNDEVVFPMLVGGNHLATHSILRNWPEWQSDQNDVLEKMGAGLEFDAWCCWSAWMKAAAVHRSLKVSLKHG